jgi:hypothetical protein
MVIAGTSGRWRAAWPWPTTATPVLLLVGLADLPPAVTAGAVVAVLVITDIAGIRKQRRGQLETTET